MRRTLNVLVFLTAAFGGLLSIPAEATAADPRLVITRSTKNPQAFVFTIADRVMVDRTGYAACGVEIAFGDGSSAALEVPLRPDRAPSVEHTYAKPMIAEVSVKPKAITRWLSIPECSIYPALATWLVVDQRTASGVVGPDSRAYDIVLLANQSAVRRNIDGTLRFAAQERPLCISTRMWRVSAGRANSDLLEEDPLLFSLGSVYEQKGIAFVADVLDSMLLAMVSETAPNARLCEGWIYGDVLGVPRFALEKFLDPTTSLANGRGSAKGLVVVGEIPLSEIAARSADLVAANAERQEKVAAIKDSYESVGSVGSVSSVGTLFINPAFAVRSVGSGSFAFCALPSKGAEYAAAAGHRVRGVELLPPDLRQTFDRALREGAAKALVFPGRDPGRKIFDTVFADLNEVFLAASANDGRSGKCQVFIGSPADVVQLKTALEREGIPASYGEQTSVADARNLWAKRLGFDGWPALQMAWAINANAEEMRRLRSLGIDSEESYRDTQAQIRSTGYSDESSLAVVLQYLKDFREGKERGITALEHRQIRLENERLAAQRESESRRREREQYAAEYPFEAVISCGFNSAAHVSVVACFAASNAAGSTALELRNGEDYGLYQAGELNRLGREITGEGLVIPLRSRFSLVAQNSSENLVLTVRLRETLSGKEVFVKSAMQYQSIRVNR